MGGGSLARRPSASGACRIRRAISATPVGEGNFPQRVRPGSDAAGRAYRDHRSHDQPSEQERAMFSLKQKPTGSSVELADRAGDGFAVTLNWDRDGDGSLWVSVLHTGTGETFVVDA